MILPDAGLVLLLLLWGGWVALDSTSAGQIMVSRPLVAATVAGWIVGRPLEGAMLGLIMEAFHLTLLPVGAARYPESGPAAVAGAAAYALSGQGITALFTAVVFSLGWAWVSGESVRKLRHLNIRMAAIEGGMEVAPPEVERRHLAALGLDFVRGIVMVTLGFVLLSLLIQATIPVWGLNEEIPRLALGAAVAGALAGSFRLFGERRVWFFLVGGACGALFSVLR